MIGAFFAIKNWKWIIEDRILLILYKRKPSTALCCRGFDCYVILSIHVLGTSSNADEMKADTALFLKIRQNGFFILLRDKLIILAVLTFMSCRQSNTVLLCNISHRRYFSYNEFPMDFFPFSVAYVIVVHIIFYFFEDLKWHTRFAIETFIWRESRMPFYTLHYI